MADLPPATLRLTIDREALAANWRALADMSGNASTGAAVKANAYGIGIDAAVPALRDAGCEQFYVAHWQEVPALLPHVEAEQIAVLHGVVNPEEAAFAKSCGAIPVINSAKQAAIWNAAGGGPCHLMLDTGINRLGAPMEDLSDPAIAALDIDILMSHLASADEDNALNKMQLDRFRSAAHSITHKRASLANSAGIALGADYHCDHTRPGLSLYGGIPREELDGIIRQVAYPEAAILQRRTVRKGESVGYNGLFTAESDTEIATVSIGYADGFLRNRGFDCALYDGDNNLPVIGRVSMDMIAVDCSTNPSLQEGDFLQIPYDLPQVSQASGFSQYELLTTLGNRFQVNY